FNYQSYANTTYTLGRLRRRAILTSTTADLNGMYGYTVTWTATGPTGVLQSVTDTLGRILTFGYQARIHCYNPPGCTDTRTVSNTLSAVYYQPNSAATSTTQVTLEMNGDRMLDRVERTGIGGYTR